MLGIEQFLSLPSGKIALMLIMVWTITWKGVALWKASRAGSKPWFIILLVLNTLGILEIIYIFAIKSKSDRDQKSIDK